jgi:hypothetical protein
MSAVGSCADNALAEGFFGMLKRERVNRRRYSTRAEARADIDVVERNYVHDSDDEFIAQTGSSENPGRLVRFSPPPGLPGSNLVSKVDATYLVSVNFEDPYQAYGYEYQLAMRAGVRVTFKMPPPYYPSRATFTRLSEDGEPLAGAIEINSGASSANDQPALSDCCSRPSVAAAAAGSGSRARQPISNAALRRMPSAPRCQSSSQPPEKPIASSPVRM